MSRLNSSKWGQATKYVSMINQWTTSPWKHVWVRSCKPTLWLVSLPNNSSHSQQACEHYSPSHILLFYPVFSKNNPKSILLFHKCHQLLSFSEESESWMRNTLSLGGVTTASWGTQATQLSLGAIAVAIRVSRGHCLMSPERTGNTGRGRQNWTWTGDVYRSTTCNAHGAYT